MMVASASERNFFTASDAPPPPGGNSSSPNKATSNSNVTHIFFKYCKNIGLGGLGLIAILPSIAAIKSSQLQTFVKVGGGGALLIGVFKFAWSWFEKRNKENIIIEKEWVKELNGRLNPSTPLEVEITDMPSRGKFSENYSIEEDDFVNFILDPQAYADFLLGYFESSPRFSHHFTNGIYDKLEKENIALELAKELSSAERKILISEFSKDRITERLMDFIHQESSEKYSLQDSEDRVSLAKSCSVIFKMMSNASKVFKGYGQVGEHYNCWNGESLKNFYNTHKDPISFFKISANLIMCFFEYICINETEFEIKAIEEQVAFLQERKEKVEKIVLQSELSSECQELLESSISATEESIAQLDLRKAMLKEKNSHRFSKMIYNLLNSSLSGMEDLISIFKEVVKTLKDKPNLFDFASTLQEWADPFLSCLSLCLNIRKLCVTGGNFIDARAVEKYCKKTLEDHKKTSEIGEISVETDDIYAEFLALKQDAVNTEKWKQVYSGAFKVIKIVADILKIIEFAHAPAVIAFSATLSMTRFCYRELYLQRHHIVHKITVLWETYVNRVPQFRELKKCEKNFDTEEREISQLQTTVGYQNSALEEIKERLNNKITPLIEEYTTVLPIQTEALKQILTLHGLESEEFLDQIQEEQRVSYLAIKANKQRVEQHLSLLKGYVEKTVSLEAILPLVLDESEVSYYQSIKNDKEVKNNQIEEKQKNYTSEKNRLTPLEACYQETVDKIEKSEREVANKDLALKVSHTSIQQIETFRRKIEIELQSEDRKTFWKTKLTELGFVITQELTADIILKSALSKHLPIALKK